MGANKEKVYTIYETADGRKELKMCYATSTAWVLTDGRLTETVEHVSLLKALELVRDMQRYDGTVRN
ncbi:MAG: hypothetical protein MJZ81_06535 [Bacteroidales bacterium]|nr:hypothetical protein [Bacteroidales bacterium]